MMYAVKIRTHVISTVEVEAGDMDEAESLALYELENAMRKKPPAFAGDPCTESRWGWAESIDVEEIGYQL